MIQRLLFVLMTSKIIVASVGLMAAVPPHALVIHQDQGTAGSANRQHTTRLHHQNPADQDANNNSNNEDSSLLLQNILQPSQDCTVDRMSGTDLAYIGDVVYELFVRSRLVWPSKRTSDLQNQVVALVRGAYEYSNPKQIEKPGILLVFIAIQIHKSKLFCS